jgi:hypothetical protein
MYIILRILIVFAGIWAALSPASYGFLFILAADSSTVFDLLILGTCILLVLNEFKYCPNFIWFISIFILIITTSIEFFYLFRDVGESGPLPYEWLNGYYKFSLPLIILSMLSQYSRWKNRQNQMYTKEQNLI